MSRMYKDVQLMLGEIYIATSPHAHRFHYDDIRN